MKGAGGLTIVIATGNAHKVHEIRAILGGEHQYLAMRDFPEAPIAVEDAPDFRGNATKKALTLSKWLGGRSEAGERDYVLADDSGLEVDALNGLPGVHSARFAALDTGASGNSPDRANNEKLLRLLSGVPDRPRTARFRCVIALTPVISPDMGSASPVCSADEAELQTELFEGTCEGSIITEPRGLRGFGYDPLFIPTGYAETFAELGEDVKNRLSHRAKALARLKERLARLVRY